MIPERPGLKVDICPFVRKTGGAGTSDGNDKCIIYKAKDTEASLDPKCKRLRCSPAQSGLAVLLVIIYLGIPK